MNKFILVGLVFSASLQAIAGNGVERFAKIDFNKAANMSARAQEKIEKVVNTNCQPSASSASLLTAKLLETKSTRVDQGIVDVTYKVEVKFHGWEQYDHEAAIFTLTDYAGTNPSVEWVQIEGVELSVQGLCR